MKSISFPDKKSALYFKERVIKIGNLSWTFIQRERD